MFVYVWKKPDGTPFYVGMSKSRRRTDPMIDGARGWFCKNTRAEIGAGNIVVEIHMVATLEAAKNLEICLIKQYGRIQLGTGTLTNLRPGGEGASGMSKEGRERVRQHMLKNNPMFSPEIRAKAIATMRSPHVLAKYSGDNNPAKRVEVRDKIKAKWAEPGYKDAMRKARLGKLKHTDEFKAAARERLLDPSNPIRNFHRTLNTDPIIHAKRVASLRAPELLEKRKQQAFIRWANPEKRKALSEKMKQIWADRKKTKEGIMV